LNFSGCNSVFDKNIGKLLKIVWQLISSGIWIKTWGKMGPGKAVVSVLPAGLGKRMLNLLAKLQ